MEKAELIITALQQRISQMAGDHAIEIAMLRAELTELTNQLNEIQNKEKAKDEYSQEIANKISPENL